MENLHFSDNKDNNLIKPQLTIKTQLKHPKAFIKSRYHSDIYLLFHHISQWSGKIGLGKLSRYAYKQAHFQKIQASHQSYKINAIWAKKIFGENFLVPSRNLIMKKFTSEAEREACHALKEQIINLPVEKYLSKEEQKFIAGYQDCLRDDMKTSFDNEDFEIQTVKGVCYASSLNFLQEYLKDPKQDIVALAQKYQKGVPTHVAAIQAVTLCFTATQCDKIMAALLGLEFIPPMNDQKAGLLKILSNFGMFDSKDNHYLVNHQFYDSTKAQLLDSDFVNNQKPGAHLLSFDTGAGRHAIVYINRGEEGGYLFDPNYGLIRCEDENHEKTLLDLLYLYELPEGESKLNYHLSLQEYRLPT